MVKEGWGESGTLLPGSESGLSLFSLCCVQEAGHSCVTDQLLSSFK